MKQYQKVELIAKNQISGSYAAGCPAKQTKAQGCAFFLGGSYHCKDCERSA